MNEAPNLQRLVAKFGGYDKITPEAWAVWDRAVAEWQQRRRDTVRQEQAVTKGNRAA
jgi:hypothetical protein